MSVTNGMRVGSGLPDRLKAIIGKRVLEKYVGPCRPPSELYMPECCKHVCQGCGDEFVTSVGLVDHIGRRSLVISFHCTCNLSKWPLLFYNPCAFKSFYRSHCLQPGIHASRDSVVISALDLNTPEYRQCLEDRNRQKGVETASKSRSPENTNNRETVTTKADSNSAVKEIFVNLEVVPNEDERVEPSENAAKSTFPAVVKKLNRNYVVKPAEVGLPVKKGRPRSKPAGDCSSSPKVADFFSALWHNRTACRECSAVYRTRRWLATHFSLNRTKQMVQCAECKISLPTTCSLRAHQRMHENQPPFVCPQCGVVFDEAESVDVFRAHVERSCFHLMQSSSRPATSNCPQCTFSLPDADIEMGQHFVDAKVAQHFVDAHTTVYYKCRSCPKAFSNASVAKRHSANTGHKGEKDVVRKCPTCSGVFKDCTGIEMRLHVMEHLGADRTLEFRCPLCPERASEQSVIVEHMRSCHPDKILPVTTCEVCGQPYPSPEELYTHVSSKHINYFESVMKCLPSTVEQKSASDAVVESGSTTDSAEETALISESEVQSNTSSVEPTNTTSFTSPELASTSESEIRSITSSTEVLECTRCQMKFDSEDVYKRHQARHRFLESKKARRKLHATAECSGDPLQQVFCFPHVMVFAESLLCIGRVVGAL